MRRNIPPCLGCLTTCLLLFLFVSPAQAQEGLHDPNRWEEFVKNSGNNVPGKLPNYTLFTGSGNWSDAARWSDQLPRENSFVLVNGHIEITEDAKCKAIYVGRGSLSVAPGAKLNVLYLTFCDPAAAIYVEGQAEVVRKIYIRRELPEKGTWYFLASPFEMKEVKENVFTLQDDKMSHSGNYFYMHTYNGSHRELSGLSSGNWSVVPASVATSGRIFEKGKGYLFALDAAAKHSELILSSKDPVNLTDIGRGSSIKILVSDTDIQSPHHGWYLCGNPLFAPLPLSAIERNTDLDGNIYVYEEDGYKAYPIGSNYTIPLGGTFFVKAKKSTTLVISSPDRVNQLNQLSALLPVELTRSEPEQFSTPTGHPTVPGDSFSRWYLTEEGIHFEQLPVAGLSTLFDLTGHLLEQRALPMGATFIPLTLPRGGYILQICSGSDCNQYKFIWNNE